MKFLPVRKADVLTYATQVHDVLTAAGFVPASLGLTAADVTELGAAVTAAQTAHDGVNAARAVPPAPISAVEAVSTVRPYLIKLLRFMFFLWFVYCGFVAFGLIALSGVRLGSCSAGQMGLGT